MSGETASASKAPVTAIGQAAAFIGRFIGFWVLLALFLMIGYATSVAVEWLGMYFNWWQLEGVRHSEHMYITEHNYINRDLANGLFKGGTIGVVEKAVDMTYAFITPDSNGYIGHYFATLSQPIQSTDWAITRWAKGVVYHSQEYWVAARNIALVYVLRLTIIFLSLPLFIIILHASTIEGICQRERRKAGGGIESGFVYHHMKKWRSLALLLPLIFYLASPFATHPNVALIPIALMLWLLNYVFILKFKKNL